MIPLKDYNPTARRAVVTLGLIVVNVGVYFLVQPHPNRTVDPNGVSEARFTYDHAAIPCEVARQRPLTIEEINGHFCARTVDKNREPFPDKNVNLAVLYSMFLHANLLHIGGNMLFLWVFGNNIEDRMGRVGYLVFYLLAGLAAAAAHIAVDANSTVPIVGASGAIAGVMGAYIVLFPKVRIRSLIFLGFFVFIRDLSAAFLLGFWFVLQFFTNQASGVAWVAHVGGFVFGALVALALRNRLVPPPRAPAY